MASFQVLFILTVVSISKESKQNNENARWKKVFVTKRSVILVGFLMISVCFKVRFQVCPCWNPFSSLPSSLPNVFLSFTEYCVTKPNNYSLFLLRSLYAFKVRFQVSPCPNPFSSSPSVSHTHFLMCSTKSNHYYWVSYDLYSFQVRSQVCPFSSSPLSISLPNTTNFRVLFYTTAPLSVLLQFAVERVEQC